MFACARSHIVVVIKLDDSFDVISVTTEPVAGVVFGKVLDDAPERNAYDSFSQNFAQNLCFYLTGNRCIL